MPKQPTPPRPLHPTQSHDRQIYSCSKCGSTEVERRLAPGSRSIHNPESHFLEIEPHVVAARCAGCRGQVALSRLPGVMDVRIRSAMSARRIRRLRIVGAVSSEPAQTSAGRGDSPFVCPNCGGRDMIAEATTSPFTTPANPVRSSQSMVIAAGCPACGVMTNAETLPSRFRFEPAAFDPVTLPKFFCTPYLLTNEWRRQVMIVLTSLDSVRRLGKDGFVWVVADCLHTALENRAHDFAGEPAVAEDMRRICKTIRETILSTVEPPEF